MKNHTPTPWTTQGSKTSIYCTGLHDEPLIASTLMRNIKLEECESNARHIVHCVNSHDLLVEALKVAKYALEKLIILEPRQRYKDSLGIVNKAIERTA